MGVSATDGAFRVLGVDLVPGATRQHAGAAAVAALCTLSLLVYVNIIQPFLLLQVLGVPPARIGAISGQLAALHEVVALFCMAFVGALSDRLGRRRIYAAGFVLMGVGYLAYPFVDNVAQLALARAILAAGAATALVMFTTLALDYSAQRTLGSALGVLNVLSGIGVLIMTGIMSRVPAMLEAAGHSSTSAARITFSVTAALCLAAAGAVAFGLKPGAPARSEPLPGLLVSARIALQAARQPRLGVSYAASFIGRGDLVVIGMFLPLWISQAAAARGASPADALVRVGVLLGVHQLAVIVAAPLAGLLNDRRDRLEVLVLSFALASVGYLLLWWIGDPYSNLCLIALALLAAGEISIVVTNNAMAGDEAPSESRGSIMGFLGVFGSIGVIVATLCGGWLFDAAAPTAPFLMMVGLNVLIIFGSAVLWRAERRSATATVGAS